MAYYPNGLVVYYDFRSIICIRFPHYCFFPRRTYPVTKQYRSFVLFFQFFVYVYLHFLPMTCSSIQNRYLPRQISSFFNFQARLLAIMASFVCLSISDALTSFFRHLPKYVCSAKSLSMTSRN